MLANSRGHAGGHRGGLRELRGPAKKVSHEAREAVVAARNDAGYAHQMAEGLAEVLKGLSTKGVEVDSAAFMFLGVNLLQIC